jgi:hypothetical protein
MELAFSTKLEHSNTAFHVICWLDLLHARSVPVPLPPFISRCCDLLLLYSYEVWSVKVLRAAGTVGLSLERRATHVFKIYILISYKHYTF